MASGNRVPPSTRDTLAGPRAGSPAGRPAIRAQRLRRAELYALSAVDGALASSLDLRTSLGRGLHALLEAWPYRAAGAILPDWAAQELEVHTACRNGEQIESGFSRVDLLALTAGPAVAWALTAGAAGEPGPPEATLIAPLSAGGRTMGILVAASPAGGSPHAGRPLLAVLGERFGHAVRNARLYGDLRAEADRLAAVSAVGDATRKPLAVPRLLDQAVRQVLAVTNLDLAAIYLREESRGGLTIAARSGISRRLAARLIPRLPPRPAGTPVRMPAPQPLIEEALPPDEAVRRHPRCLMHIPLRSPGRDLGVLTVGSYSETHFAPGAADLLAAIAAHIALGLDYALLYREAKERAAQLARANEAINAALHSKDQFLANVTHELRRPLAPARLVLETLLEAPEGKLSPQRRERLLRNALNNLDSLNALVSELLDAARVERSDLPSGRDLVDLGGVVSRVLTGMRPLAEERGLQLRVLVPTAVAHVYGDAQALSRVVGNLLSNAIKFNREKGSILVQLERCGGKAVLSVSDTGIGIPTHAQPHIFERFYQADGSSTRAHEGVGLGLYITREIVEQHGGQIRFDTQEGVGSTFTVTLPLA